MPTDQGVDRKTMAAYVATLACMLAASFVPQVRLWGLGAWVPLSLTARLTLTLTGLLVPVAIVWLGRHRDEPDRSRSLSGEAWLWGLPILCGLVFYLLRAQTHFQGDGLLQLAALASDQPLVKARDMGTMHVLILLKGLMPGGSELSARVAYQGLSVTAGVLFVVSAVWFARPIATGTVVRICTALGLFTGGYALLFFGYAENYAVLCLCIGAFTFTGYLGAEGHVPRWLCLIPLALGSWFHVLGLTLAPAAAYLILAPTGVGAWLARRGRNVRWGLGVLLLIGAAVVFLYLRTQNYYFRFAFLPLTADRFTTDGYTLLSVRHLADYLNLLALLLPGIAVILVSVRRSHWRGALKTPGFRFLAVLVVSTLAAAFFLDPKLGMPRDWDLFSFPGVPLVTAGIILVLGRYGAISWRPALLVVTLGALSLFPRAFVQHQEDRGIVLARTYCELDPPRSRTAVHVLGQYLLDRGLVSQFADVSDFRDRHYPEEVLRDRADQLMKQGNFNDAVAACRQMIAINPRYFTPWTFLGNMYNAAMRYDSAAAFLEIANGLNPDAPAVLNELGRAYFFSGRRQEAQRVWTRSLEVDSTQYVPVLALARWHKSRGEDSLYTATLARAAANRDSPGTVSLELANDRATAGDDEAAHYTLERALSRGVDSTQLEGFYTRFPQFRPQAPPADSLSG